MVTALGAVMVPAPLIAIPACCPCGAWKISEDFPESLLSFEGPFPFGLLAGRLMIIDKVDREWRRCLGNVDGILPSCSRNACRVGVSFYSSLRTLANTSVRM